MFWSFCLSVIVNYCNFALVLISFLSLQCPISHCQTIKNVVQHQISCHSDLSCQEPHCISTREILNHWRDCTHNDCPVCKPFKKCFINPIPVIPIMLHMYSTRCKFTNSRIFSIFSDVY